MGEPYEISCRSSIPPACKHATDAERGRDASSFREERLEGTKSRNRKHQSRRHRCILCHVPRRLMVDVAIITKRPKMDINGKCVILVSIARFNDFGVLFHFYLTNIASQHMKFMFEVPAFAERLTTHITGITCLLSILKGCTSNPFSNTSFLVSLIWLHTSNFIRTHPNCVWLLPFQGIRLQNFSATAMFL